MGVEILELKVIPDALGNFPERRGDMINFHVKTLMNLHVGETIKVRAYVDDVETTSPPFEDTTAEREYISEIFETGGSAQLSADLPFSITGHSLKITFTNAYLNSAVAKFLTVRERNVSLGLAVTGLGAGVLFLIWFIRRRK